MIAYDPAWGFVAVPSALGGGSSWVWSSQDGLNWNFGQRIVSFGNTLVASNGVFVSAGGTNTIYSSKDGGNRWAEIPVVPGYTNTPSVIAGTFYIPTDSVVYTSTDGINLNLYFSATPALLSRAHASAW